MPDDDAGNSSSEGVPPFDDFRDRWSFSQFGPPFETKYRHLRNLAKKHSVLPDEKMAEKNIAIGMGLNPQQWSRVRREKPPVSPKLHRRHLSALAKFFKLDQAVGDRAWELFLPGIPFEAFEKALSKAHYGTRAPGQYVIPAADRYILRCPATLEEYDQTAEISKVTFGANLIDLEADREAFLENPYGMVVLVDSWTGRVLGWIDIYHLPEENFEWMIHEGEVHIYPSRFMDLVETCRATRGYTASILIDKDYRQHGLVRYLLYGLIEFLLRFQFQAEDHFELFAVGQEEAAVQLLERFRFDRVRCVQMEDGKKYPLYSRQFTQAELLGEKWGFWSKFGIYRSDVRVEMVNPLVPADDLLLS